MTREIKFRAWDHKMKCMDHDLWIDCRTGRLYEAATRTHDTPNQEIERPKEGNFSEPMQFTGLRDKNGKEIYEDDLIRIKCGIGDEDDVKDGRYHDGYYSVSIHPLYGIQLSFRKIASDDPKNQFPIHSNLTSHYGSLSTSSVDGKHDQIIVAETWGENHMFKTRWKQNHYSNDLEIIGNIYENPELLAPKPSNT